MKQMELIIPAIPAAVTVLLNFFAPYAVALVVNPVWPSKYKKLVAIVVAVALAVIVLVLAFVGFGIAVPAWPVLLLLAIVVAQSSYDLVLKKSADRLALTAGTGSSSSTGEHVA